MPAERGPSGTGRDTAVVHPATRDLWAWLQGDVARALSAEKRTLIAERIMGVDADLLAWDAAAAPVVSPADTPADEFPDSTPRPWYFDGWDIFTSSSSAGPRGDGHRLVIPLKAINDTFHPSQRVSDDDARLIVQAVNERDALLAVGERDRQHIAQLTEELRTAEWGGSRYIGLETCPLCGNERTEGHEPNCALAAVLADEEDARPDALERQMTVTICDDCSCQAKKIKGGWSCPCCGDPATVREVTVTALVSLRAAGEGDT